MAHASLNGRRKELLINPDVDLATQPRTLNPEKWILPLTTPLDVVEDNEESGVQIKTIPTRQPSPSPIRSVPTRQPSPAAIQE